MGVLYVNIGKLTMVMKPKTNCNVISKLQYCKIVTQVLCRFHSVYVMFPGYWHTIPSFDIKWF